MSVIPWNKQYGETLTQTLERFRLTYPEYSEARVTYAGRLDPLAHGLMLLLTGEDVYHKESYLKLDKVYEVDVLFGMTTDTYDILGMIDGTFQELLLLDGDTVHAVLGTLVGKSTQTYPPYSSKTVQGKPLWRWAREGSLSTIELPTREIEIYRIELLSTYELNVSDFIRLVEEACNVVRGDFRQNDIRARYNEYFKNHTDNSYQVYRIRVYASSGTYMRSLAHKVGQQLGIGGIALRIHRTHVGEYHL
ncbi:hypothetical protein KC866_02540 [Patescibacteria group bacterium]|nr:hypothetical protein [Patescibacteria group bacterium]